MIQINQPWLHAVCLRKNKSVSMKKVRSFHFVLLK